MNNRYQLINPFISEKIYETKNITKAAKKFYNEIKEEAQRGGGKTYQTFTLLDIDTKKSYVFKIKNHNIIHSANQIGGCNDAVQLDNSNNGKRLKIVEERVNNLEMVVNGILTNMNTQINTKQNNQDTCVIM